MKFVLGVLPRDTRHVLGGPCEDIPILTEEVDELAFLFAVEAGTYDNVLAAAGVFWVELHFLGLLGGFEGGLCHIPASPCFRVCASCLNSNET